MTRQRLRYVLVLVVVAGLAWAVLGPDAGAVAVRAAVRGVVYHLVNSGLRGHH